ncbi:MAG: hypothetical protein IJ120_03195 [Solobacterium sp.]|nr:hypothetical protein [Solobacterium sp.]
MSKLLVGAAKACINPTPDMFPVPTHKKDWGKAASPINGVYDDMSVRAIAMDNGTDKMLFMSYETSTHPAIEDLEDKIAAATGFPADRIIISGTHNHTAPHDTPTNPNGDPAWPDEVEWMAKFREIEETKGIECAKAAVASMRPAKYGFGESLSYVNVNRDMLTPGGYWVEARNLAGYSDHTLAIIKFVDEDGKLIAALMNHGTHATCCYMMKDADGVVKISGNFTGIACRFVEEHYGDGAVALWTSGAAGNQNPLLSHGMQYEYPDGYSTAVNYPDGVGHMQMEYMGRWHGADCVKGIDAITEYSENMPITLHGSIIDLPAQKKVMKPGVFFPFRMGDNGVRDYEKWPVGTRPEVPDTDILEADPENPVKFRLKLVTLGDIAMLCCNAELYAEIGRDMKAASPFKKTFVVTHTDYRKAGYILDKTAAARGEKVFQAFSNVIPGSADDLIIEGEKALFDKLLEK